MAATEADWLINLKRQRSMAFWSRHSQGLLPFDTSDYVFFANAMLRVGAAKYGEAWNDGTFFRAHLPILLPQRTKWTDGADADYALAVLARHQPDVLTATRETRADLYKNPLTLAEWTAAEDIYENHERAANFAAIKMAHEVRRAMTRALADGLLVSVLKDRGTYREIPAGHWDDEVRTVWRFLESQMMPDDPWKENWPTIIEEFAGKGETALVPGNAWIFVTEASLEHFISTVSGGQPARAMTGSRPGDSQLPSEGGETMSLAATHANTSKRPQEIPERTVSADPALGNREWLPFLEAVTRACQRLFLTDFRVKPLLLAACNSNRIQSRGQYDEAGRIVISGTADLSQDPTVMKVGGFYYVRETYPAEIEMASLQVWIASMEDDSPSRIFPRSAPQITTAAQHRPDAAKDADGNAKSKSGRRTAQRGLIEDWLRDRHKGTPPSHMTEDQRTADVHDYAENVAKSNLRPDEKTIRKALKQIVGR